MIKGFSIPGKQLEKDLNTFINKEGISCFLETIMNVLEGIDEEQVNMEILKDCLVRVNRVFKRVYKEEI